MNNQEQKTILLVEDETVTMMVATHVLQSFGYDVVPAKSGEEAVQIATGNDEINLVLMDVNLGDGIDGPEAAKQILLKRNLPIVFLSSHTEKEYVERIKGIAGYGYVVKTSNNVVLQSSIEMALNLFKAEETLQEKEALQRYLMAKLPVGIIIIDPLTRTIESVNARAAAMFGVAAEQIVGHRCHSFLCPAQEKNCPVLDLGKEVDDSERVMLCADGSRRPVLKSVSRIQLRGQEKLLESFVDIAERKRAEDALRDSEEKHRLLIEKSHDIIYTLTAAGVFTFVSPAWTALLGHPTTLVVGHPFQQFVHPDDIPGCMVWLQKVIETGQRQEGVEYRVRHTNGSWYWHTSSAVPLRDQTGTVVGFEGIARDITERKRAEEALRESERSLAITFRSIGDAVMATDFQGRIVRMNRVAEQLTGWPLKEALGRPLDEVFHIINQHTRLPLENPVSKVLETGKIHGLANDTVLVSRQGVEFIIADSAAAIMDDQTGKAVGVVLVFRDQTKEHTAAAELLFKTMLMEAQSETSIDGILAVDNEGHSILFNKRFGEIWKIPQQILDTKDDKKMLAYVLKQLKDPAEFSRKVAYLYEHKDEKSRDEIEFADGRCFDRYSAALIGADGKHHGRIWYFRDITERKELQAKLLASEKLAVMGRLVADVAHEINNPLAIIAGNTFLLEETVKEQATTIPDSADKVRMLEKIKNATNRCKNIVASLFVSTCPTILNLRPTDINGVIEESLESLDDQVECQNVKIVKDFFPRLPLPIIDGHRLMQVFINMFRNACDAMPEGGKLRIVTRLYTPKAGSKGEATGKESPAIEIEISDTGVGILEKDLPKIFDPFVTTKKEGKGVGLGLSVSYGIVKEHGGSISVTSEKGKGATFTIRVPVTAQH